MNSPEAARKLQHVAQCTKQLGLRLRWWGRLEVRLTELVSLRSSLPFSLPFDRDLGTVFCAGSLAVLSNVWRRLAIVSREGQNPPSIQVLAD
jgi:hypothetical protein